MKIKNEIAHNHQEIAVIGMACKFPDALSINEFWENVWQGKESVKFYTKEEVIESGVDAMYANDPHFINSRGGEISDRFGFDAEFFNYTADEAVLLDPQIRLMHECVYNALLDAGYPPSVFKGQTGLFAGASSHQIWEILCNISDIAMKMGGWSSIHFSNKDFGATLVSYKLGLQGPCLNIDTGCSTSLVAIHLAAQSLLAGECDLAVAGGTSANASKEKGYLHKEGLINSRDGRCRTFDEDASGTFFSEGAGMVVLKRLDKAIEDNDHIYAVIKGSAINNDGNRKGAYTAPSVQGQMEVIQNALKSSNVDPNSIGFVETHGTGTNLGDPIEIKSLRKAFNTTKKNYCYLGALKASIGHLDAAAGVAGFMKAILVLKNKTIPPLVNFRKPNPLLELDKSPFAITNTSRAWESDLPRRAGVNSFGIGGTNAHVILEEFSEPEREQEYDAKPSRDSNILMLSAKSKAALEVMKRNLYEHIKENESLNLSDLSFTLQTGRDNLPFKESAVFKNRIELLEIFEQNNFKSATSISKDRKIVFAFPGQGMQYVQMGRELYLKEIGFRNTLDECFRILKELTGKDYEDILFPMQDDDRINQTVNSQPILFSFQYALAKLMDSWNIQADAFIGHSIGEYVAACLSGVFSLKDALYIVAKRAEYMQQMDKGEMLAINLNWKEVLKFKPAVLSFASINSPDHCVLSGHRDDIASMMPELSAKDISFNILKTSHAFHSTMMHEAAEMLQNELSGVQFRKAEIPFISNVTGDWILPEETRSVQYWAKQLKSTVQLDKGLNKILEWKDVVFLEIGPGNSLSTFVKSNKNFTEKHSVHHLIKHAKAQNISDADFLVKKVSDLWLSGVEIDWNAFHGHKNLRRISLPAYPFVHKEFMLDSGMLNDFLSGSSNKNGKRPLADWFYISSWKKSISTGNREKIKGRWLITGFDETIIQKISQHVRENGNEEVYSLVSGPWKEIVRDDASFKIDKDNIQHYSEVFECMNVADGPISIIDVSFLNPEDDEEAETINTAAYIHLLYLSKSLQKLSRASEIFLNCVTVENFDVLGNEKLCQNASVPPSVLRVISQEFFHVKSKNIDLSTDLLKSDILIKKIYDESNTKSEGTTVALRNNNTRWIQSFDKAVPAVSDNNNKFKISKGSVYFITGGLGEVGFILAKYLCGIGAKVALLGRTELNKESDDIKEKQKRLKALQAINGDVLYLTGDVTRMDSLRTALDKIETELGKIKGVFHLSAVDISHNEQNLIPFVSPEACLKHFRPKAEGAKNLKKVFEKNAPDFIALFSSLSAVLGGIGYFGYAASNAYLDRFAEMNNMQNDTRWISFNWDVWDRLDAPPGNLAITEKEGFEIFDNLHTWLNHHEVIVSVYDLEQRINRWVRKTEEKKDAVQDIKLPELERPGLSNNIDLPVNQQEEELLIIWKSLFGYKSIGVNDDFFELGGDSLKALHLINAIRSKLKKSVSLSDFFRSPSIRGVTEQILLQGNSGSKIQPAKRKSHYVLSSGQRRLYFLHELNNRSIVYNLPKVFRLKGALDKERLKATFNKLLERHEILRTSVHIVDDEPVQMVSDSIDFEMEYFFAPEEKMSDIVTNFIRPFDLSNDVLLRAGLIELSPSDFFLLVDIHHFVTDGISHNILFNDFRALYCNDALPELKLQYKDYAEWQQSSEQQVQISTQKDFWMNEFKNKAPVLELPTDFIRPSKITFKGEVVSFHLNKDQVNKLRVIAQGEGATMFMMLLAIYNIVLSKLSNQQDIVIGVPVSGRVHADLEGIMGLFVNTLALRNFPESELPFSEFLSKLKNNASKCFDNQGFQYETLIDSLNVERDTRRNPLFDVMFSYENEKANIEIPGLIFESYNSGYKMSKFDITLSAYEAEEQIFLNFEYSTALFKEATIKRFADYFKKIVTIINNDADIRISEIELISDEERYQLLHVFNDTTVNSNDKTVVDLFEEQVQKTPEAIAIQNGNLQLTYNELQNISDKIASYLTRIGNIKNGDLVGIILDPSDVVPVILGILKAGAAYVPIDPRYPADRVDGIVTDSRLQLLICRGHHPAIIKTASVVLDLDSVYTDINTQKIVVRKTKPESHNLAYVIYTSGSTGLPKGVMIKHGSLANYIVWAASYYGKDEKADFPLFTSISFDLTVTSIFTPLVTGNKIIVYDEDMEGLAIEKVFANQEADIIKVTPSHLQIIKDSYYIKKVSEYRKRKLIVGGEQLETQLARHIYDKFEGNLEIYNEYGPTEATVGCIIYKFNPEEVRFAVPIGKPVNNTQVYILDNSLNLVPVGVVGEICIAGKGISRGYLNNEALTKKKFLDNPFRNGEKMYRTGDLARWLPDGKIEFLGRTDDQVKIRGMRIELGEIENQLLALHEVKRGIVVVREEEQNKYLVAYYVSKNEIESAVIKNFLSEKLPDYMVPAYYVHLSRIPLTVNGKIDRNALPELEIKPDKGYEPPTNEIEEKIVEIWSQILRIDRENISIKKSFFDLGGNSLKLVQLNSILNKTFKWDISIPMLFRYPTISALVNFISEGENSLDADKKLVQAEINEMEKLIGTF